jgi:uncharacterized protein YgiB involved in biofilm formation
MAVSQRRRSAHISLVILGVVALAGCGGDDAERRDLYTSRQDCVKDWGDETKCEAAPGYATSGRTGTHYWGPAYSGGSYRSSSDTHSIGSVSSARPGSHAVGTSHVSRGGFGSSASSHSSSGS